MAGDVISFATTPMGPFEAVDRIVTDVRTTGRQLVQSVGLRVPTLQGQVLRRRPLEELRKRVGF